MKLSEHASRSLPPARSAATRRSIHSRGRANVNLIGLRGVYDEAKLYAQAMTMAAHLLGQFGGAGTQAEAAPAPPGRGPAGPTER